GAARRSCGPLRSPLPPTPHARRVCGRFFGCDRRSGMGCSRKRRALGQGREAGAQPRANLYDEVTRKIISELEAGRFPWVQPWDASAASGPGLPRNALTGRRYSGVNVLLLWGAAIEGGHASQHWLTFRQALEAGGNVRKGEKGTTVVYADRFIPE